MDTNKLTYYDQIVPLFKTGKLTPDSEIAQGTAPHTVGFVEGPDSKTFASGETEWFTMVPTIYNADTPGHSPGFWSVATSPPGLTFSIRPSRVRPLF